MTTWATELTPLVLVKGLEAAAIRRRRGTPLGWLPVYIGLLAQPQWKERGTGATATKTREIAIHVEHWCWISRDSAFESMALQARQGVSPLVVRIWTPVRETHANPDVLELGAPRFELVKDFCCKVLAVEVEPGLVRAEPGSDGFWRRRLARTSSRYATSDPRGWVETTVR